MRRDSRIAENDHGDNSAYWNDIAPKVDDDVAGHDLEGYQSRLENEEVVTSSYTESLVDISICKADEGRRDRHVGDHLGHAVGDTEDERAPIQMR